MLATEIRTDLHSSPARRAEPLEAESSVTTVGSTRATIAAAQSESSQTGPDAFA